MKEEESAKKSRSSRWDVAGAPDATPVVKRSRWDQAPSLTAATPVGNQGLVTPIHPSSSVAAAPAMPLTFGLGDRNAPLSDEELDEMLPKEGYKILEPPPGYAPIRTPARKLMSTPAPMASASGIGGFMMQECTANGQADAYGYPWCRRPSVLQG